jgi:hypothetical protein
MRSLTATETEDEMEGRLLLDVIIREGTTVLELLASEDKTLLVWGDTFLVLNLRLDVVDSVRGLDLEGNSLTRQGLDKDLHSTTETQDQVEGRLLLDVIVRKSATVLELFAGENEALLIWGDAFLILDFGLYVVDGVAGLDLQRNGLAREGLDENLHTSSEAQDEVEGGLLLDVVVREGAAVLELFTGKDQALLVWGDTLLVLDLGLDIVNGVGRFHLEGDRLASQSLDENLHSSTETEDQVEGGLLLDVVIRKGAAVFELLARKDEALLVWGDALLVLDFGLDIVNGIGRLHLEGDGLSSEGLRDAKKKKALVNHRSTCSSGKPGAKLGWGSLP